MRKKNPNESVDLHITKGVAVKYLRRKKGKRRKMKKGGRRSEAGLEEEESSSRVSEMVKLLLKGCP